MRIANGTEKGLEMGPAREGGNYEANKERP
jgi:hypothetical protein